MGLTAPVTALPPAVPALHRGRPPALAWWLAAVAVAAEVPYPLTSGALRTGLTVTAVLAFAAAGLAHAAGTRGAGYAVRLAVVGGGLGFGADLLGVHTGVPFGSYRYTGHLGPELAGVPLLVAAAWTMMICPSLAVSSVGFSRRLPRVLATAAALAAWDVVLDPQMVDAHRWVWSSPGPHLPGVGAVPLSNLGGWLLTGLVIGAVLTPRHPERDRSVTRNGPPLLLYAWSAASGVLANLAFFHHPWLALWGGLAMGGVLATAAANRRRIPR